MITSSAPSRPLPQPTVSLADTAATPEPALVPEGDVIPVEIPGASLPPDDEYDCTSPRDGLSPGTGLPCGFGREGKHGVPESMLVKLETLPWTVPAEPQGAQQPQPDEPEVSDAVQAQFEQALDSLGLALMYRGHAGDGRDEPYLARLEEFDARLRELDTRLQTHRGPLRLAQCPVDFLILASCVATHPAGWPFREPWHWRIDTHLEGAGASGSVVASHALRDISAPRRCWTDPACVHQLVADSSRGDPKGLEARRQLICMDLLDWMQPDRSGKAPDGPQAIARELARHLDRAVAKYFGLVEQLEKDVAGPLRDGKLGVAFTFSVSGLAPPPQRAQGLLNELQGWSLVFNMLAKPHCLALTPYGSCCAGQLQGISQAFEQAGQMTRAEVAELSERVALVVARIEQHRMPSHKPLPGSQPDMDLTGLDTALVLERLDERMPQWLQKQLVLAARDIRSVETRFDHWTARLLDTWVEGGFDAAGCKKGFGELLQMYRHACDRWLDARDALQDWTRTALADRQAMRSHLSHALTEDDCLALEIARDQRLARLDGERQGTSERAAWMVQRYRELASLVNLPKTLNELPSAHPKSEPTVAPSDDIKPLAKPKPRAEQGEPARRARASQGQHEPPVDRESTSVPIPDSNSFEPKTVDTASRRQHHLEHQMRKDTKDGVPASKRQSDLPGWLGFEFITPRSGSSSSTSTSSSSSGTSGVPAQAAEIAKLRAALPGVALKRVPEVTALFGQWGYSLRIKGDHMNFDKPNTPTFTLVARQGAHKLEPQDERRVKRHLFLHG